MANKIQIRRELSELKRILKEEDLSQNEINSIHTILFTTNEIIQHSSSDEIDILDELIDRLS